MLHIQQEITNGLLIEQVGKNVSPQRGRDVFQFVYETADHKIWLENERRTSTLKHALDISEEVKRSMSSLENMWFLDHYYRHLFRIFKYIDDAEGNVISDEKKSHHYPHEEDEGRNMELEYKKSAFVHQS